MTDVLTPTNTIATPSIDEASTFFQEETKSRFYERKLPEVRASSFFWIGFGSNQIFQIDELVMVEVKTINDIGSFVKLLEYDELEGFIAHSELSRANRIKGSLSRVSLFSLV